MLSMKLTKMIMDKDQKKPPSKTQMTNKMLDMFGNYTF